MGTGASLRGQLIRGALGNGLVQVMAKALSLLLGVVLARALGAEGYGVYAYAIALMTVLAVPAELGTATLLVRETAASLARKDWSTLRGVLSWSVRMTAMSSVAIAGAVAVYLHATATEGSEIQYRTFYWMLLLLPVSVALRVIGASLQGLHQVVKSQFVQMVLRQVLLLAVLSALFMSMPDYRQPQYAMAMQFLVGLVSLLVLVALLLRHLPEETRRVGAEYHRRKWMRGVIPFTIIGGTGIINNQADILMLGYLASYEEVGFYRVAMQAASLVAFGLTAANAVLAPQFSRLHAKDSRAQLQRVVTASARAVFLSSLPVAGVLMMFGGWLAAAVFGAEFANSHLPMAIIAGGQMFNAAMGSVGFLLSMTGHEADVARTLLFTAMLNIILNYLLIPGFGMAGAASATAISLCVWNILLFVLVKKRLGISSWAFAGKAWRG